MFKRIKERVIHTSRRIKDAMRVRGAKLCMGLFMAMYVRPWTGVLFVVHQEAARMAKAGMRKWLVAHRMAHCARCLELGPLRKAVTDGQQVYLCDPCFKTGAAVGAVQPALEIVKP